MPAQGVEQDDPAGYVDAVVDRRIDDRLADERLRRAVEDGIDRAGAEEVIENVRITEGTPDQPDTVWDGTGVAGREIVEDRDRVARGEESFDGDRADIAGTAGDEDVHDRRIRADIQQ
jgi:hypothetical protein